MAEARRFGITDLLLLLLVLVAAAALRGGYLLARADYARKEPPARVQDPSPTLELHDRPTELRSLVQNLKEHSWFGTLAPFADKEEQTAHVAPGLPWLLSGLARVVPEERFESVVRCTNAGLGALTAVLYFLFARRAFRSLTVATVAGLLCAAHPFWIVDTGVYEDGALTSFLLGLALLLGARSAQTGGPFASLLYGLTLAGLCLVRAALLPFAFVALVWFLIRSRTLARGWLCGLLAFLGFANGLAPWTVRNVQVFGEPMPVVDSLYLHLWIGNNPKATGGPLTKEMLDAAPTPKLRDDKGQPLKQPARYAKLAGAVVEEVRERPVAAVQRRIMAGLYFVFGERMFADGRLADGEAPTWLRMSFHAVLLGVLLLAVLGWRWTYAWRKESPPLSLALIWIPLPYLLSHAEALSGPRLPLDGVLLTYAAFALCALMPKIGWELREAKPVEEDPSI